MVRRYKAWRTRRRVGKILRVLSAANWPRAEVFTGRVVIDDTTYPANEHPVRVLDEQASREFGGFIVKRYSSP